MPCLDKMAEVKIEDIVFWIIITTIIAVVIWMLSGSPPIENSLPSLIIFVIASEILLWKALFSLDKKTEIGFMKVKGDLRVIKSDIEYIKRDINNINNKLNNIENLIKKKK